MTPRILVIGDVMLDVDVELTQTRVAPEGCPVWREESRTERLGGAGAVAVMADALGAKVALSAVIGTATSGSHWEPRSEAGRLLRRIPSAVRCTWINGERRATIKERLWVDGRLQARIDLESIDPLPPADAARLAEEWPDADAVLVADHRKGVITPELWLRLVERFPRTPIIVDPAPGVEWSAYRGATAIVANREEARVQDLRTEPIDGGAARKIAEYQRARLGLEVCIVKLDRHGFAMATAAGILSGPSAAADPLDTCGAGDQFLAALGVTYARTRDWSEAARVANIAAGLKCGKRGTTPVARRELEAALLGPAA